MMTHKKPPISLKSAHWNTPLGSMIAVSDAQSLYLLAFTQQRRLERHITSLKQLATIAPGQTEPIFLIQQELSAFFSGKLQTFTTPLHTWGSPFQKEAWQALINIPYGQTRSYREQAQAMGHERAIRAVANANGMNPFAIIIPCHRVLRSDGTLGGYAAGIDCKRWLLHHERSYA